MDLLLSPQGDRRLPKSGNQVHLELMLLEGVRPQEPEQDTLGGAPKSGQCSLGTLLHRRHLFQVWQHELERANARAIRSERCVRGDLDPASGRRYGWLGGSKPRACGTLRFQWNLLRGPSCYDIMHLALPTPRGGAGCS